MLRVYQCDCVFVHMLFDTCDCRRFALGLGFPQTLFELCIAEVCCSLDELRSKQAGGSLLLASASFFPQEIADQLLHKRASEGQSGAVYE